MQMFYLSLHFMSNTYVSTVIIEFDPGKFRLNFYIRLNTDLYFYIRLKEKKFTIIQPLRKIIKQIGRKFFTNISININFTKKI